MMNDWTFGGSQAQPGSEHLIIGIDFGTTYSGVAWAMADDFEQRQINSITNWPGRGGTESSKVPTEIWYNGNNMKWGYEIPPDVPRLQFFKLLLLDAEDFSAELKSSPHIQRARDILQNSGKTAIKVIADYLRLLWAHAEETLRKTLGKKVSQRLTIGFIVTIPAIWKPYARQRMEEAVEMSGILTTRMAVTKYLSFAPEPEAAAIAALLERQRSIRRGINQGDIYVVCDAGGGTVDLITYMVESAKPIRIVEAVEGTGGLCGRIFIDQAFEQICKKRLDPWWDGLSWAVKAKWIQEEWKDSIKHQFKPGYGDMEYSIVLPTEIPDHGNKRKGRKPHSDDCIREPYIKGGRIHFRETDIEKAFKGVLERIGQLIGSQIKNAIVRTGKEVTGVILVGGLGCSPCLYQYLDERFDIDVLQSPGIGPRTAIAHGAVYKGLMGDVDGSAGNFVASNVPIQVTATISRNSHYEEDRFWSEDEGMWYAKDQIQWHLKKGERVSSLTRRTHPFYQLEDTNWDGHWQLELYYCDDASPPDRWTSTNNVELLCTLDCTMDNCMPVSRLRNHFTPSGKKMKLLDFNVRMIPTGGGVVFDVEVNGTRLGMKKLAMKSLTGDCLEEVSSSFDEMIL
ncbi:hypothetical protein B0T16DRAFT_383955 [Cercophora newfieldiana]|uniref:Uncharacterized protein n=1 Tax=Cercophora newfieldiana TaxID=92897 RepID=A0AA39YN72_9PEZI|nr:hypothetical protein B0T16DRAFT_383955 [Cercophora newfieldiana]